MTLPAENDAAAEVPAAYGEVITDVAGILGAARRAAAHSANSMMTAAYP